jgi:hypothetical protein
MMHGQKNIKLVLFGCLSVTDIRPAVKLINK